MGLDQVRTDQTGEFDLWHHWRSKACWWIGANDHINFRWRLWLQIFVEINCFYLGKVKKNIMQFSHSLQVFLVITLFKLLLSKLTIYIVVFISSKLLNLNSVLHSHLIQQIGYANTTIRQMRCLLLEDCFWFGRRHIILGLNVFTSVTWCAVRG